MSALTLDDLQDAMDRIQAQADEAGQSGLVPFLASRFDQDALAVYINGTVAASYKQLPDHHRCRVVEDELGAAATAAFGVGVALGEAPRTPPFLSEAAMEEAGIRAAARLNALAEGRADGGMRTLEPEQVAAVFAGMDVDSQKLILAVTELAQRVVDDLTMVPPVASEELGPLEQGKLMVQLIAPTVLMALLIGMELERGRRS